MILECEIGLLSFVIQVGRWIHVQSLYRKVGQIRTDSPAGKKTIHGGSDEPPPRQDLKSGGTDQCETGNQSQGVGRLRGTENGNGQK